MPALPSRSGKQLRSAAWGPHPCASQNSHKDSRSPVAYTAEKNACHLRRRLFFNLLLDSMRMTHEAITLRRSNQYQLLWLQAQWNLGTLVHAVTSPFSVALHPAALWLVETTAQCTAMALQGALCKAKAQESPLRWLAPPGANKKLRPN